VLSRDITLSIQKADRLVIVGAVVQKRMMQREVAAEIADGTAATAWRVASPASTPFALHPEPRGARLRLPPKNRIFDDCRKPDT